MSEFGLVNHGDTQNTKLMQNMLEVSVFKVLKSDRHYQKQRFTQEGLEVQAENEITSQVVGNNF